MRTRSFPGILALAFGLIAAAEAARADLLISELCDPRLNYQSDRFLEIYNSGSEPVDLTNWRLVAVANSVDVFTWQLSGSIAPGEALVAGDATTVVAFPVDFADENWSNSNGNWNGKVGDGAKLIDPSGTVIDQPVVTGTYFENCDFVRDDDITSPNPLFVPAEWIATPVDYPTQGSPGEHDIAPPIHAPTIATVWTDPAIPLAGDSVDILASVTDAEANIVSVSVRWGTEPASLPDSIAMELVSGSTYRSITSIPVQPSGTTVYYQVEAVNDIPGIATSDVLHYILASFYTVHAIQGEAAVSPLAGQTVVTTGVVTARFASSYVIQQSAGPWDGLWVLGASTMAVGDSVTVRGVVDESTGNTMLTGSEIIALSHDAALIAATPVPSSAAASEAYEGVLIEIAGAACTANRMPGREWEADDGSGTVRINDLGYAFRPILGTRYDIIGPVNYAGGAFKVEPRDDGDLVWAGDNTAPIIWDAETVADVTVRVTFSEPVDPASASVESHYSIEGLTVFHARRDEIRQDQVLLTVDPLSPGTTTLDISGVADLHGNAMAGASFDFRIVLNDIPAGYYAGAEGLTGEALQAALHNIIRNHTVRTYDFAWTAFYTTDDKPNGKVWDIYSDIPYGTPPYEYTFGVDQGGAGVEEGNGYTREHTWPKSWFGGEIPPMHSDLFILYPTDAEVNGQRGNFPFGEVEAAAWVSLNGSEVGACSYPGYGGTVFEPLDDFKGDLARAYMYMSTRYYGEDAAWPGSPMTDGAQLLPWALEMMIAWSDADPVSVKEIERNSAVYGFQNNRNPFVDHPEFVHLVFDDAAGSGEQASIEAPLLFPSRPNPFVSSTTVRFAIPEERDVRLSVCDVNGREVRVLLSGRRPAGELSLLWDGRNGSGHEMGSGVYFLRLEAGEANTTQRLLRIR